MNIRYKNPDIPLAGRVLIANDNATRRYEIASAVRNRGHIAVPAIKANERLSWIPVIVISMPDRIDDVVRVIELGATDCLPVGYNSALLDIRVTTCLERKWRREQESAIDNKGALIS